MTQSNTPPGDESKETSPEKLTVEQIKNPFFWIEYNKQNSKRVETKSGPRTAVRPAIAMMPLPDPESCGSFSTQINGHRFEYRIFISAGHEPETLVLYLKIDGRDAIRGYSYTYNEKLLSARMEMPEDQIAALLSSEKEPQPEPREVGDVIDHTRRNLK